MSGNNPYVETSMGPPRRPIDVFEIAEPLEMLEPALDRLRARGVKVLVVVQHGRILGMVTHLGVGEILTMRRAAHVHP